MFTMQVYVVDTQNHNGRMLRYVLASCSQTALAFILLERGILSMINCQLSTEVD